jgi:hypothetical protein
MACSQRVAAQRGLGRIALERGDLPAARGQLGGEEAVGGADIEARRPRPAPRRERMSEWLEYGSSLRR